MGTVQLEKLIIKYMQRIQMLRGVCGEIADYG
jgi:hypothetical protein